MLDGAAAEGQGPMTDPGIPTPPSPGKLPPPRLPPTPENDDTGEPEPGPMSPPDPDDAPETPPIVPDRMPGGTARRP